jgi:hypothetical protein
MNGIDVKKDKEEEIKEEVAYKGRMCRIILKKR